MRKGARYATRAALAASLGLGGCFGLFDDSSGGTPPPDLTVYVAVGAEVGIELHYGSCSSASAAPHHGCLSENPDGVVELSLSKTDAFELLSETADGSAPVATVAVRKPGRATLTARYHDVFGHDVVDEIPLRALEVDRVDLFVPCVADVAAGVPLAVSAGAEFTVNLSAWAGDHRLATGDLPLVTDSGGLPISLTGQVVAPQDPGTHVVQLRGEHSEPVTFAVFSADEVAVTLEADPTIVGDDILTAVRVLPKFADGPACIFDGDVRAHLWIAGGDCATALGGIALDGRVPVDLDAPDGAVPLRGEGLCDVFAAVVGGDPGTLTVELDAPFGGGAPWDEQRVGTTPIMVSPEASDRSECRRVEDLSAGGCEILDAAGIPLPSLDCLRRWEWVTTRHDRAGSDGPVESNLLGAGLTSELHTRIEYEVLLLDVGTYPPADLYAWVTPATGLVARADGCVDDDHAAVVVEADAAGTYEVRMSASNIDHDESVELRVHDVAAVRFGTVATEASQDGETTRSHVFTGVVTDIDVKYEDADGVALGGWAPFSIVSDDPDARAAVDDGKLHTGNLPHVIRLASTAAANVHEIDVVDADAIATIEGVVSPTLEVGEIECIAPVARAADGLVIGGRSSEPPRVTIEGDALVVEPAAQWPDDVLCFRAIAPGQSVIELDWGPQGGAYTWTVQ